MPDAVLPGEYYQDDEFLPESPLLEARIAKTPQSTTPPPLVATSDYSSGLNGPNIPRSQDEENLNRRKKDVKVRTRPTQGDWVLIREMDPNRPDAPVPIRGPGFPALRAQTERLDNKLREEKANSIYAEGNASTPVTQVVRRQESPNWFQTVVGKSIQREEEECTATEEAERAAEELEAARKATEEQQQSHQERNTRRPEDSLDDVLEHSPASLPSISRSSRPVSNRQPIIIQPSPPTNQQSSTALAPPVNASVATSHNEVPPNRGLSRNMADQGEDASRFGSLSQTALKDGTQEASKTSTEKIRRKQSIPSSSQGQRHSYYSSAGAVIQPATTRPRRPSVSRPVSYSSKPGPQYHWTQGAPTGYAGHPQDYGPPLSQSALYGQNYSGQMGPPRSQSALYRQSHTGQMGPPLSRSALYRQNYSGQMGPPPRPYEAKPVVYGENNTRRMSTHGQASNSEKSEIRLRVDANAPLSLQFNGDMEGRTMRLIPGEDGMAELVISGNDADLYKTEQERKRQNRRPIVYQPPRSVSSSSSEGDSEGIEVPEAQTPSRRRFTDKDSRRHRDPVVKKARQDYLKPLEYNGNHRSTDVPLDDPIHNARNRVSKRKSVVDFGEKEEKTHENNEDEVQSRSQDAHNRPVYRRPQSVQMQYFHPSSGSYSARPEAAKSDPVYWDPRRSSHRAPVVEPATTRQLRRPSVVTRPVSYSAEPGSQYHRPEQPKSGRRQEESERQAAEEAAEAEWENVKHVRFELGRADSRAKEKAEKHLAEKEKDRAAAREVQRDKRKAFSTPEIQFPRISRSVYAELNKPLQESLASDRTAAATESSSQPSPKEYTTRIEQQKELKKRSERQSHSPSPVDLKKIMSEMIQKAKDQVECEDRSAEQSRPEKNAVLRDMVTKLMNKGPVSLDLHSNTKSTHAAATYSVSSDEYETASDSDNEPDSREYYHSREEGPYLTEFVAVPMSPVSKDLRKIQKIDDSELKVEEKQTKQTTLSAWDGEVLQKSREVQIDAVVGSPGDNESLAAEVEEYPDANLKHRRPVTDSNSNPSTDIIASEKPATDVQMDDNIDSGYESVSSIREYDRVKVWLGEKSVNRSESYSGLGYDGFPSGPSSYAASVASIFSVASLASSASVISRGSGYSADQIATATKVLLSVFYEDKTLLSLYKSAIGNEDIGPERLQRNLRRFFRKYAGLLESEATERLEYLSSRLVLVKSAFLAQSIVEKLQNGRVGAQSPRSERDEESSDEEDNKTNTRLVNEDAFEDLAIFREFLVDSEAFRTFRDQLEAFVLPKPIYLTHEEPISKREASKATTMKPVPTKAVSRYGDVLTWQKWRRDAKLSTDGLFHGAYFGTTATSLFNLVMDAIFLATDDLLIAAGRLEPPLSPNMVRLRWQCACGDSLHSDVSELRKGGIDELISHMQRTSGAKVLASPHSHQSGNQKYVVPNPTQWIQKAVTSIFGGSAKKKDLKQDRIEEITTDRALLCFLRKQYRLHRGRFLHALSLQSVKGISFVKFRLPIGGSVDVRHHDPCCVADTTGPKTCECIPPLPKVEPSPGAEYRCIPGPPATYPPIPPVYLASLFSCPTDVHEKDTWILDQLPKRTCGELKGQIGQPAEGWGIYYDEGLDGDMLAWTILIVFLVASLLFGVLWSKFQYDIQGAFGVSAYMVACCAAVLPVIVTRLGNKG
ncbi:unnamed protein product [Alternaria alternata]